MLSFAQQLSRTAQVNGTGGIDLLASVGGWRGLAESVVPSAVFLVGFIITTQIWTASICAVAVAAVFSLVRILQKQSPLQALTGLAGVVLCVAVAIFTGEARQYYVVGFWTNIAYGAAMLLSMVVKWPLMGLIYGFLRGEGIEWRQQKMRYRKYQVATAFLVGMFALRLIVQLPMYWADSVAALGIARLVMGIPLYAMTLWLAWLVSRPAINLEHTTPDTHQQDKSSSEREQQ